MKKEDFAVYDVEGNIKGYFVSEDILDDYNNGQEHTEASRAAFCAEIGASDLVLANNARFTEYQIIFRSQKRELYKALVYRQGSNWVLSDTYSEYLPYYIQTKQQVREYLQDRLDDRYPGQYKLRVTWA